MKRLHASTHLSQMGQEGNALYCFTKAHFICKNAINTLGGKKKQNTEFFLRLHYCQKELPKMSNSVFVQTKVTRDTQFQHYYSLL